MSNDPKIEKLVNAMKNVPEKLAAKWIEVTESTNVRIAEFEKNFAAKEKEFKSVVDKLADREQAFTDLKASFDKIQKTITEKDNEINKLNETISDMKNKAANTISDDFLNIVNKFISDIQNITDKIGNNTKTVINEVKPVIEKTVISDPVTEEKPKKKTVTTKKETPVVEVEKSETADDESVDAVLADLGITDL